MARTRVSAASIAVVSVTTLAASASLLSNFDSMPTLFQWICICVAIPLSLGLAVKEVLPAPASASSVKKNAPGCERSNYASA